MARSKLDPNQIIQDVHCEESHSNRVRLVSTDMSMELSADDGDSIMVQPRYLCQKVNHSEEVDVEKCSSLKFYVKSLNSGNAMLKLQVSPIAEGDFWVDLSSSIPAPTMGNCSSTSAFEKVMAKRARIVQTSGEQEIDIYLVGNGN